MFIHQLFHVSHDMGRHIFVTSKTNWIQPELTFAIGRGHVNMRWLVAFIRVEMKTKRAYT